MLCAAVLVRLFGSDKLPDVVGKADHANRLPDAEEDPWCDTSVETLDAVLLVDVSKRVADGQLFGTIASGSGLGHALHFDADDLDGLIPGGQSTADTGARNALSGVQLVLFGFAREASDRALGETREAHSGSPVGALSNRDGVDTLVDPFQSFSSVDVAKHSPRRWRLDSGFRLLVPRDLGRLHARTESHGSIRLCDTARHASEQTSGSRRKSGILGYLFNFSCGEKQHSSLGRRFDPSPWNQSLVEAENTSSRRNCLERLHHRLLSVRCHLCLDHLERLTERRHLYMPNVESQNRQPIYPACLRGQSKQQRTSTMFMMDPTAMLDHENPFCCGAMVAAAKSYVSRAIVKP